MPRKIKDKCRVQGLGASDKSAGGVYASGGSVTFILYIPSRKFLAKKSVFICVNLRHLWTNAFIPFLIPPRPRRICLCGYAPYMPVPACPELSKGWHTYTKRLKNRGHRAQKLVLAACLVIVRARRSLDEGGLAKTDLSRRLVTAKSRRRRDQDGRWPHQVPSPSGRGLG